MSKATDNGVTVKVGKKTYCLKPTIAAVRQINLIFGGLKPAMETTGDLNCDALAQIILAGSEEKFSQKDVEALGEAIWDAQFGGEVLSRVMEYLGLLLNGGRPPADEETEEKTEGNG